MVETIKKIENIYHLEIGVQGENIANAIQMDMSSWIAEFPSAHIHLLFKPYNSIAPSPMITELDGDILTWYPSFGATAVTGVGYTEVRAIDPDTGLVKKSRIIPTAVENSVTGNETTPPAPYQDWVNSVLAMKDSVENYRDQARDYAEYIGNAAAAIEGDLVIGVAGSTLIFDIDAAPSGGGSGEGGGGSTQTSAFGTAVFGTAVFS